MINKDFEIIKPRGNNMHHASAAKVVGMFPYDQLQDRVNEVLSKEIFFIIGIPKSGTTWVQNILNAHPDIWCSGEQNFRGLARTLEQLTNDYNNKVTNLNQRHIRQNVDYLQFTQENLNYLYLNTVWLLFSNWVRNSNVRCFGAKNPDLVLDIELFAGLFAPAKFIHIIRDGRDVITSGWFHNYRMNTKVVKAYPELRRYVEVCVRDWSSALQKARPFGRAHPERYFELRYEDLHRDPDTIVRQVLEFLGVDGSKSMLDRCRQAGEFKKLSKGRQRGHEDRGAFFRKGIIGDWKNHFDQESLEIFMHYGGDLLHELGYE